MADDLAVHLPAYPQQQNATGERQPDDGKQLHGDAGKGDAQHNSARDAPEDHPCPQLRRDPGGREADDDGVVAGQHDVDDDDLCECDQLWVKGFHRCSASPFSVCG